MSEPPPSTRLPVMVISSSPCDSDVFAAPAEAAPELAGADDGGGEFAHEASSTARVPASTIPRIRTTLW
jgi:hypothetical protein